MIECRDKSLHDAHAYLSRRRFLAWGATGAGAIATSGLLAACQQAAQPAPATAPAANVAPTTPPAATAAPNPSAAPTATIAAPAVKGVNQLVIATGGGALSAAYKKAYFEPFTQKTGIKVVEAANDIAKLKAMVESKNPEWDLAQIDAALAAGVALQSLLEPLDYGVIDRASLVEGVAKESYVQSDFAGATIAWNTTSLRESGPKTWGEFWDTARLKGKRGFWKKPTQTLELALLADGVEPKALYPLDVDRAFKSLDKIKNDATFWTSGAQSIQLLMDGEIDLSMIWNGRIQGPKEEGKPVDFTFNQALLVGDAWAVPKGSRQKDAAMQFIAFALTAPQQAIFSQSIPYSGVHKNATAGLPADLKAKLPPPPGESGTVLQDFEWWAKNEAQVTERFNQWLLV